MIRSMVWRIAIGQRKSWPGDSVLFMNRLLSCITIMVSTRDAIPIVPNASYE